MLIIISSSKTKIIFITWITFLILFVFIYIYKLYNIHAYIIFKYVTLFYFLFSNCSRRPYYILNSFCLRLWLRRRWIFSLSLAHFWEAHKLRFMSPTTNWHTSWEITRFKYDLGRHISHHHAHNLTSDAYRTRQNYISNLLFLPHNRFLVAHYHTRSSFKPLCDSSSLYNIHYFIFLTFLCSLYFPFEYMHSPLDECIKSSCPTILKHTYEMSRIVSQLHKF